MEVKISTSKNIELYILLKIQMNVTSGRFQYQIMYSSIFQRRIFLFITKKNNNTLIPLKSDHFMTTFSFISIKYKV